MGTPAAISPDLYLRRDMNACDMVSLESIVAAVVSARQPDKATDNEDAAALFSLGDGRAVLALADGLGGHAGGAEAAEIAMLALQDSLDHAARSGQSLRTAILDAFEHANERVSSLGIGAGTTLAVAEVDHDMVRPYHAGDSMIMAVGQRGRLKLQTISHSPVGYAVESGILDENDAMDHVDRHLVSNIVGTPDMRIEVGPPVQLGPRDTVLLASDGLFDNLAVEEITELVRKGPLDEAARRLLEAGRARMLEHAPHGQPCKPDDLTFILCRLLGGKQTRGDGTGAEQ